jgi:nitronate monooxygenase
VKPLNQLVISGREVLPLVEGGKGISVSNGESSGAWAATGGVGTFSGVNADSYSETGQPIPQIYHGRTRRERHEELVAYAIAGGIQQARVAHERSNGEGRIHMNVLWEMAAAERVLHGVLEGAKGLIHGVTCGAGMPYKIAEICARYGVHYYPIVSSGRAFRALWKRAYHKFREWLGGVVYEDPWLAGGHNGITNSEDPQHPEPPYPRVRELRRLMVDFGLAATPIFMAGGVWYLREWLDWIDNRELGPVAFQFGTRPLLTQESPIPEVWKRKLMNLREGEICLNRFSPTGFYSSAVRNGFLKELQERSEHQVAYTVEPHRLFDGTRQEIGRGLGHSGFHRSLAHARLDAHLCYPEKGHRDPHRPDRLYGLPQRLPVLELGAKRGAHDGQQGGSAKLLHSKDTAGDQALG